MPNQEFKVTYAGVTVGGDSTVYTLDGPYRYDHDYVNGLFEADVIVAKNPQLSEAQFATNCAALETAFRTPRGSLVITLGSNTMRSAVHSTDTGFNAEPSIAKVGDEEVDTGRSRRYRIKVKFTLPADLSGQSGRRSSSTVVSYDSSRIRTVTFSGEYTSIGGAGARETYAAGAPSFFSAALSGLGGTYELVAEEPTTDDANKICTFRAVYREIVYAQSSAGLDLTAIVAHSVSFRRSAPTPGDSDSRTGRRETIQCTYSCNVRGSQALEGLWANTIKPYLVSQFKAKFPAKAVAVISEDPTFEHANQMISGSLTFSAVVDSDLLECTATMGFRENKGLRFTGAWTGKSTDHYVDQGFAEILLTHHVEAVRLGLHAPRRRISGNNGVGLLYFPPEWTPEGGSDWYLTDNDPKATPKWVGAKENGGYWITEIVEDCAKRYATKPPGGGGGPPTTPGGGDNGGGSPVTTPGGSVPPGLR